MIKVDKKQDNKHNITIIDCSSSGYFERAERIIELYNEASRCPYDEKLSLTNPENTRIICSSSDNGGILLDYHVDQNIWRIMFAAFDKGNRGAGLLTCCLKFSRNENMDIALVEINDDSETHLWKKLGYSHLGLMGMSITLSNQKLDFIDYHAVV